MDGSWSRLPGGGWLQETDHGTYAAEACRPGDGEGYVARVMVRGKLVMECGPFADAAHAAGVARGWALARLEGRAGA